MYLPPLDSAVVVLDLSLKKETLDNLEPSGTKARRKGSPEARVARAFHPVFGAAVARAARKVEVIDSSAGTLGQPSQRVRLRRGQDTVLFALPAPTADSARYVLVIGSLRLAERSENMPRRFVSPQEPEFDPTTGAIEPGNRKGYTEGPGLFTLLRARAEWMVWDAHRKDFVHRGFALGEARVRGEPTRQQWEELARDLAKSVLRQTAFSPW